MDPTPGKPPKTTAAPQKSQDLSGTLPETQAPTKVFGGATVSANTGQKAKSPPTPQASKPPALDATDAFAESPGTPRLEPKKAAPIKPPPPKTLGATEPITGEAATAKAGKSMAATGAFADAEESTQHFREPSTDGASSASKAAPSAARGEQPGSTDATGEVFGDFRLDKKLGEGGMGAVYKAHQISMDRTVALKMLSKNLANNEGFVARFYREAQTMAKLDHPNVVRGYAVGEVGGQHFVAMEFIDGCSMQAWMNKLGKLPVGDAMHVVLCASYALQHAHERSLVHRDIKPDNILVTKHGVVKVADLGLAKKTDDDLSLTQSGTGFGTPFYMPLEQYRDAKHVDARADVYALGVTLYYFLTGKLPFNGATHFDVIKAKETAKFVAARRHNPEIPERLDLMIDKMIQKERSHRYQSCAEVIESLESLGLASESLSFVSVAAPGPVKGSAPTVRAGTLPQRTKAVAAPPPPQDTPDMWLLRYNDERGRRVKKQVSSGRLKQLIERDEIDLASATVARAGDEKQRPLASIGEFSALVQSKMVKAKADQRSQNLDSAYTKIERDARRRRIFKAIDSFFRSLTSVIILLAFIAALAIGGWWLFRNKDTVMQKVQDAAKSVQDVSNSEGSSTSADPSKSMPPQ